MRTSRLLVAALAAPILLLAGSPASAEDATGVVINEVESNGGSPGDWVELANTGTAAVDISGWVLKDNDDTHVFTVPAGTVIAGGGYLALDVEVAYGLGGADSARLFDPQGTLVDSQSWTAHAATTYGRCGAGFVTTTSSTKGAVNDCSVPVRISEVESNGGSPGDWVELVNTGAGSVDLSGWVVKDNDDTHVFTVPAGTTIPAGGYLALDTEVAYGLGGADSARLFDPQGVLVDSYSWTAHAPTTYGRCPVEFKTTTTPTKGAANDCSMPVRISEVESNGGTPGDWVELVNTGATPADVSGWVLKDNDDTHVFTIPAGTVLAAGAFAAFDVEVAYGLGGADSARLFAADGVTLVDSYSWTVHAATTYGRCGAEFATTTAPTKGAANACAGQTPATPWPGGAEIATVDDANVFGGNMSGLAYQGSTLWAVRNGPGTLYRLAWDGTRFTPALTAALHYADGTGDLDAEGVTLTDGGVFVATERNNANSGVSRPAIERFALPGDGATSLNAAAEWNLTADLPAVGANLGLEGITFVPDAVLTAGGFVDERTGAKYDPAAYPNHGGGIFFVGVEANGTVYGYALDQAGGAFTRVATIVSGFPGVMDLQFEAESGHLWVVCDDTCQGRTATFDLDAAGRFARTNLYERPAGMPNLNNEGLAIAPQTACVAGRKPVVYADDSNTEGHALRAGTLPCTVLDSDGDGIDDAVDAGDDAFTGGKILDRNGRAIHVDAALVVTVGAGTEPALFQLAGSAATIALGEGTYSLRGPLATISGGPAVVTVAVKSTPILITVAAGGSVTYTDALTGIQQSGPVSIRAASQPADACAGIAIQNVVVGGTGNEQLAGTTGNDLILGRGGNDVVAGKGGTDCVTTGPGNDTITTADGSDWIDAGGGNNVLNAAGGDNVITAASGNDTVTTGSGNDRIAAGGGNNVINAGDGANVVTTASGNDTVTTGAGADIVDAGNGNNTVNAGAGDDQIGTGSGNDTVDCGAGTDGAYVGKGKNTNAGNRCETYGV